MEEFVKKYINEAKELITNIEELLLKLEKNPCDNEIINNIFRNLHTIKGGAAMFGFQIISEITHETESIFDLIRKGKCSASKDIIDITFKTIDFIKKHLNKNKNGDKVEALIFLQELKDFKEALNSNKETYTEQQKSEKITTSELSQSLNTNTYRIFFKPDEEILKLAIDPIKILRNVCQNAKTHFYYFENTPTLDNFQIDSCYSGWLGYIATNNIEAIKDAFIFVEDNALLEIEKISDEDIFEKPDQLQKIIDKIPEELERLLIKYNIKPPTPEVTSQQLDDTIKTLTSDSKLSTLRISADKVDNLMNQISELISIQARLNNYLEKHKDSELETIAENIQKILRQLRDTTFEMSMVPLKEIIIRLQRLVRELSNALGKSVEFETFGTNTELDKRIIENLVDPLMHIIRNCIDHGIETPDERLQKHKPPKGKIFLNAYYSGTYVYIEVGDDGRGIDTEKIKKIALEKGFLKQKPLYSEAEILDVLFETGFSTSQHVSEVSGRGIGLDIVRKKVNELRGEVAVKTEVDKGTTFIIKLPLTLSIIDGLLIEVSDLKFIIPLNAVEKIYHLNENESSFYNLLLLEGKQIPYVNLQQFFSLSEKNTQTKYAIKVITEDKEFSFIVDNVLGEYQIVLKPLGKIFSKIEFFSGATILGDGSIAFVLDLQKIVKSI